MNWSFADDPSSLRPQRPKTSPKKATFRHPVAHFRNSPKPRTQQRPARPRQHPTTEPHLPPETEPHSRPLTVTPKPRNTPQRRTPREERRLKAPRLPTPRCPVSRRRSRRLGVIRQLFRIPKNKNRPEGRPSWPSRPSHEEKFAVGLLLPAGTFSIGAARHPIAQGNRLDEHLPMPSPQNKTVNTIVCWLSL